MHARSPLTRHNTCHPPLLRLAESAPGLCWPMQQSMHSLPYMQPFHPAIQVILTYFEARKVSALHVLADAPQPIVTAVAPLLAQAHLAQRQV